MNDLLTPQDVADRLGVTRPTVLRWARTGQLPPPIRLGSTTLRWEREMIDELIRAWNNASLHR